MPDSRYYDIKCRHDKPLDGPECCQCKTEEQQRAAFLRWSKGFTQERLLKDLLNANAQPTEFGIYVRSKDGELTLINTHSNLPKDLL